MTGLDSTLRIPPSKIFSWDLLQENPPSIPLIGFGKGICGQVAETGKIKVVQDVNKEDNYLSCSVDVQSEIVVPVLKKWKIHGRT